ncbi:oxidoreductase 2OG-Fe(II) oxygenase family [Penicillium longicatenatum]|uniref:oxidoreductase 2OG-Fe(II) oxygenase family n=1 Tax=Penicillium longicatenatum TaxID=1561947 RepID=UPI0025469C5F|nr:oxidoreductase 2OG-Fe(II) oxygenase family [Penicillium longicatenatum]KAJ5631796.1 oxidoreductase 2OG-Fe(II) oxygenase family [Penicillium longicatenatum]
MPTIKYFNRCPPFPSEVPTVPLPKVSLEELQNGSEKEGQLLFQACQEWGFFLLNLERTSEGSELLENAEKMFDLTNETYNLDQSVLDSYAYKPPHDLTGYKRKGQLKTDDGKMDCMELYSINQDDMLGNKSARNNVDTIEAKRAEVRQFIECSHSIIDVIFSHLDQQLGLEPGTLSELSPLNEISETSVRLLRSQSQSNPQHDSITLGGHTDIGTITLLFNVVGGLQILPADRENKLENWLYVKPEPGNVLVNIGDTLVEWTGGLLRSSLHRVITAPGEQALETRQSVAYLVRPRNNASMQRLKSGVIPVVEQSEEEETRSVVEWASWRAKQVMLGQLKPQTRGGRSGVAA